MAPNAGSLSHSPLSTISNSAVFPEIVTKFDGIWYQPLRGGLTWELTTYFQKSMPSITLSKVILTRALLLEQFTISKLTTPNGILMLPPGPPVGGVIKRARCTLQLEPVSNVVVPATTP
jgi:hypothetical protein